ncbi:glycosyltransferase family 39 protein [Mycolicibacterium grossiae]|uniref:glycosyltransferase family 39 protein n=1 Tax=Mycolicibacterium grossiae TaxID=1552759 RepID=UPI001FE4DBB3|nr:glycosyltransferase family 39 protein [Mycolicibacterium grossiae]
MIDRRPRWALAALLIVPAGLYTVGLSASGYGNPYYAAAAQAGARSWAAWFFGALDARGFITVDKPPAALWVTGLSVRLFGLSSWSVLAPQAVMGVAAVALLYAAVRRTVPDPRAGTAAGLLAGLVLAVTPAAAVMFRFDDPDALLVLLLTAAGYAVTRAVATASGRWLAGAGALVGVAFLTKMAEAFLVLPALAAAYLAAAPTGWRAKALHLAGAAAALVGAAGWWVAVVALVPAHDRPYVGGSADDSVLDLAWGYNGVSRLVGRGSAVGGTVPRGTPWRLLTGEMGQEISWLLPAAVLGCAGAGWLALRGRLTRVERGALVWWSGWLVVAAAVLTAMRGTQHAYYSVTLAPPVAATVALAAVWAWREHSGTGRAVLAALVLAGAGWSAMLLRHAGFRPAPLVGLLAAAGVACAALILVPRWSPVGTAAGAVAALVGTVAFGVATAATAHEGVAPEAVTPPGAPAARSWTGDEATNADLARLLAATSTPWSAATNGAQSAAVLELSSGTSVMAVGGWSGDPVPTLDAFVAAVHAHLVTYWVEAGRGGAAAPHGEVLHAKDASASHTREIADWVAAHHPAVAVGDSLVYRLS